MRITGGWISRAPTQRVCDMLSQAGHQALFVGGCVRNALLGQPVADIDIATDARPETVISLAGAAHLRAVPTGIDHGTVTIIADGLPHEVTTFRRDVETDGRRAVVAFTDDVSEDARRRDFTMNALYADATGTVIDPLGGLADLQARRVRFIEDAEARIREDYLRILRFFRFHAWYGDPDEGLDPKGLAACAALAEGLEELSKERIGAEMRKLLAAPDPAAAVASMAAAGCLVRVLPGADARALPVLVQLERRLGIGAGWLRRLAVLGSSGEAERLRLSRQESRQLSQIRDYCGANAAAAELGYRLGADLARDCLLVRAAMAAQPLDPASLEEIERGAAQRFPVGSADIALEGPALGQRLRKIEDAWIASDFSLTREELLRQFP